MIETGVDKLVNLVKKAGRISVADAAEKLGISEDIVEEWADFLDEEGIISIDYKFATAYLQEKKLSNKETKEKENEFKKRKDIFVRKADIIIKSLDKESTTFKTAKDQFEKIKSEIGSEVEHVRSEVEELEKYEEAKKNLDAELIKQKHDYAGKIKELESMMEKEKKKYKEIMNEIFTEEKEVEKSIKNEECYVEQLDEKEMLMEKKVENFKIVIGKMEERLKEGNQSIYHEKEHIGRLKKLAKTMQEEVEAERKKAMDLVEESKIKESDIVEAESEIIRKIKEKGKNIKSDVKKGKEVSGKFEKFFNKKLKVYKMMTDLEHQKHDLQLELNQLVKKAQGFAVSSKSGDAKAYARELDKKFNEISEKKSDYEKHIKDMTSLLK